MSKRKFRKPASSPDNHLFLVIIVLLIIAGITLRILYLGKKSLWLDEAFTAMITSRDLLYIIQYALKDPGPLPLTYIFPWLAQKIAGNNSEFTLRFFDFIYGSAGLIAFYFLARLLKSESRFVVVTLTLLTFSAVHHYYSQDARGYTAIVLLSIIQFLCLWQAIHSSGTALNWWFGYYVSMALAFYFSLFTFFLLATNFFWGVGVLLLSSTFSSRQKKEKVLLLSAITFLLLMTIGFWLIFALPNMKSHQVEQEKLSLPLTILFLADSMIKFCGGNVVFAVLFFGVILLGWWTVPKSWRLILLYPFLFLFVALIGFLLAPTAHFLHIRYLIAVLPMLFLAFSLSLTSASHLIKPRTLFYFALGLILLSYLIVNFNGIRRNFLTEKQNWRAAANFIARHFQPDDVIFAGANSCSVVLYYYLPASLRNQLSPDVPSTTDLEQPIKQGRRVWYATAYYRWAYRWRASSRSNIKSQLYYDWIDQHFQRLITFPGEYDVIVFLSKPLSQTK